jgi:uncharacterized membrane protein YeiH
MAGLDMISILNLVGVTAFAVSGALKGMKNHLDILGIIVLGIITALGGGIIRDVLLNTKPESLTNERDMYFAIAASLVTYFAGRRVHNMSKVIKIFDAAGLALFTVIGAEKGIGSGMGILGVIIMGTLTGVAGGVVRDLLVNEIPFVLKEEVYAFFCIVGAILYMILSKSGINHTFSVWFVISLIFVGRVLAIALNLQLPRRKL